MKLSEISSILQDYCHLGFSLDKVLIKINNNVFPLESVFLKEGDDSIIIEINSDRILEEK